MIEYVFIEHNTKTIKIECSKTKNNLPDFSRMGLSECEYEARLQNHKNYLETVQEADQKVELIYSNLLFFLSNIDEILRQPRFSNMIMPQPLYTSMFATFGNPKITLGEILQIYKNEPHYSAVCPNCGGTVLLIRFGFSPLSGRVFPTHRCYGSCKKHFQGESSPIRLKCAGSTLVEIRDKYSPSKKVPPITKKSKKPKDWLDDYVLYCKAREERNIIVSENAWTENFALVVLNSGLRFCDMPKRFKTQDFLQRAASETDFIPNLAELSPKLLTASVCVKAILARTDAHANSNKKKTNENEVIKHSNENKFNDDKSCDDKSNASQNIVGKSTGDDVSNGDKLRADKRMQKYQKLLRQVPENLRTEVEKMLP